MKKINHKHIVNLHEVLSSPTKLYMVLELVTGGELFWRIGISLSLSLSL